MRRIAIALFVIPLALAALRCTDSTVPGRTTLGQYRVCQTKVVDTCHDSGLDAGCTALEVDGNRTIRLAVRDADGALLLLREQLDPIEGALQGTRFVATNEVAEVGALCGCTMKARESIRGELSSAAAVACESTLPDGGSPAAECHDGDGADAGSDDDFLAGGRDTPLADDTYYGTVHGRMTTVLEPAGDGCRCDPCRIEYEFTGHR